MSHNQMSDSALQQFSAGLKENNTLTDLFFTHNHLDTNAGPGSLEFVKSFGNKSSLRSLALNSCNLNGALLEELKN